MVYVISAFLFSIACVGALLFAVDRALKTEKPDATELTTQKQRFYAAALPGRGQASQTADPPQSLAGAPPLPQGGAFALAGARSERCL
jgi:hypothetical protein